VFVVLSGGTRIYITTPDNFSKALQELNLVTEDVFFQNVSLERLLFLKDGKFDYIRIG
ncbi:unnamed protein product, partial [marine sediment metagenome]